MIIRSSITAEGIPTALNVVPPSPLSYARFLERFLEGTSSDIASDPITTLREWADDTNRMFRTPKAGFLLNYLANAPRILRPSRADAQGWQLPETISRKESMPIRAALASAHLRVYVDEWLQTGRRADGSEWPAKRNLNQAPDALIALWDYLKNAPVRFSPSEGSDGFELTGLMSEPTAYLGEVRDFFDSQIVEAKRIFAGLMASEWKDRLCKCRYHRCGRYFLHPKPRQSYRHGTFCCRDHASHATAEQLVRRARIAGTATLIDAAARKLGAWRIKGPQWQDDVQLKHRLASELCLVISRQRLQRYREAVKVNWVSRHQKMIERRRCELFL